MAGAALARELNDPQSMRGAAEAEVADLADAAGAEVPANESDKHNGR